MSDDKKGRLDGKRKLLVLPREVSLRWLFFKFLVYRNQEGEEVSWEPSAFVVEGFDQYEFRDWKKYIRLRHLIEFLSEFEKECNPQFVFYSTWPELIPLHKKIARKMGYQLSVVGKNEDLVEVEVRK